MSYLRPSASSSEKAIQTDFAKSTPTDQGGSEGSRTLAVDVPSRKSRSLSGCPGVFQENAAPEAERSSQVTSGEKSIEGLSTKSERKIPEGDTRGSTTNCVGV